VSDFLQRLAERTLGGPIQLRPATGPMRRGRDEPLLALDFTREVDADEAATSPRSPSRPVLTARAPAVTQPLVPTAPALVSAATPPAAAASATPIALHVSTDAPAANAVDQPSDGVTTRDQPSAPVKAAPRVPANPAKTKVAPASASLAAGIRTPRQAQPAAVAPQPPVIQVSIGRVEVRATPPASSPSPRPPAPELPSVALSRYLDQRERGRR
jgi:hypothetical protein